MFKRSVPLAALVSFSMLLLTAPASAQPFIEAAPAQLEYGAVDLHFGGNPQQNVKFTNNTSGTLLVTAAELSGADPSGFQIVNDGCTGNFVGAGENCSLEVVFTPGARGAYAATLALLTLDESAGEVSAEVPISASAATGTPSPSPSQLTFSPIPYNPPESFEGENNESQSLDIQNSSDFGTQLQSVSITGPDAADFAVEWGNCENDQMGPSNSCGMGIRFRPSATGARTASLVVQSDSADGPIVVPLSGEGLHGPQMTLDTTQALLGNVALGHSAQHTFTVTNTGDYLLYIQRSFLVTGTPLMFPVRADSCSGRILSPSESCAVTVGFQPTTLGEKSAAMLFITNTPAINVAGIDGIGIQGADEADPSLSMPPLSTPAPATPAPAPAPVSAAVTAGAAQAPTLPSPLTAATRAAPLQAARPRHARPRRRRAVPGERARLRNAELPRTGRHRARFRQRLRRGRSRARLGDEQAPRRPGHARADPAHAPRRRTAEAARAPAGARRRRRARRRRDRRSAQLDDEARRRRRRLAALRPARPSGRPPGRPCGGPPAGAHAGMR